MASQLRPYSYSPLNPKRTIRLLSLYPSLRKDAILQCHLTEKSIDECKGKYEAISYVWGTDESQIHAIYGQGPQYILLRPNLARVLYRLRQKMTTRVLWADAICINQEDDVEKGFQLAMMGDIYRGASDVAIYLATNDTDRDLAATAKHMAGLSGQGVSKFLGKLLLAKGFGGVGTRFLHGGNWAVKKAFNIDQMAAFWLCTNQYWQRVWTLQEHALAKSSTLYFEDQNPVSADSLLILFEDLNLNNVQAAALREGFRLRMEIVAQLKDPHPKRFMVSDHIQLLFRLSATKDHDRIFSLTGLFPGVFDSLPISYTRPLPELYTDSTRMLIQAEHSLRILEYSWRSSVPNMPSWALDWGQKVHHLDPSIFLHGDHPEVDFINPNREVPQDHKPMFRFSPDGKKLFIQGIILDTLVDDGLILTSETSPSFKTMLISCFAKMSTYIWSKSRTCSELAIKSNFDALLDLLRLTARLPQAKKVQISMAVQPGSGHAFVQTLTTTSASDYTHYIYMCKSLQYRALFVTNNGYMACPWLSIVAKAGDKIVTFPGEYTPFIIRPAGKAYKLVGPALVTGTMKGEYWSNPPFNEQEIEIL